MSDVEERLTRAFEDLFAVNSPWFGGGGRGYYGVQLENVALDGSVVDLVITFRSGECYCCFESACHFSYHSEDGWGKLRSCMDAHDLNMLPLPVIRVWHGVIEGGAFGWPSPKSVRYEMQTGEYRVGPLVSLPGC